MERYKLRTTNYELQFAQIFCVLSILCALNFSVRAQSTNQNYPTPVSTNEISGKIPARDIGDARLTNYFYIFNARQGDVFINVVTSNFNGDIDVFTADNLRPLTKITVYAGDSERETGRVIYMRKPEKLVLRIEGRTPNDDVASFRIKFAGSFEPLLLTSEKVEPEMPVVKTENQSDVVVNSVGTIIEVKPKPTPSPKETIARNETKPKEKKEFETKEIFRENENKLEAEKPENIEKQTVPKVIITDEIADKSASTEEIAAKKAEEKAVTEKVEISETAKTEVSKKKTKNSVKAVSPAELANINLVILFKDGSKIERPMNEVLRVNVDKGILTVISKDGSTGRYSILDVVKMTIE